MSAEKKLLMVILGVIIVGVIMAIGTGFWIRSVVEDKYNQGVACYESGDFEQAANIFHSMKNVSLHSFDITPEEYYERSIDALERAGVPMVTCPDCGKTFVLF